VDVGLRLKSTSRNEKTVGLTQRGPNSGTEGKQSRSKWNRSWHYSEEAVKLILAYKQRFPRLFLVLHQLDKPTYPGEMLVVKEDGRVGGTREQAMKALDEVKVNAWLLVGTNEHNPWFSK
jgi:hypothetical protein